MNSFIDLMTMLDSTNKKINIEECEKECTLTIESTKFDFLSKEILLKLLNTENNSVTVLLYRVSRLGIRVDTQQLSIEDLKETTLKEWFDDYFEGYLNGYFYEIKFHKNNYCKTLTDNNIIDIIFTEKFFNRQKESLFNLKIDIKKAIIFKDKNYFYNSNILFTNVKRDFKNDLEEFFNKITEFDEYKKSLNSINKFCNSQNKIIELIPENLYFKYNENEFNISDTLKEFFKKNLIRLVMEAISNYNEVIDSKIQYTILGPKTLKFTNSAKLESYKTKYCEELFLLYSWIYENNTMDKIDITRNVINVLITAKWAPSCPDKITILDLILKNSKWLKKSCEDNYKNIIENKVKDYFLEKKNIMESLKKNLADFNNNISDLTKNINTILTTSIAAIVAGSLGYVAKKDLLMIKIVAIIYIIYITLNLILNLPIIGIRKKQLMDDFKKNEKKYEEYLEDDDIKYIKKSKKINNITFNVYIVISILIVVLLDFIVLYSLNNIDSVINIINLII